MMLIIHLLNTPLTFKLNIDLFSNTTHRLFHAKITALNLG